MNRRQLLRLGALAAVAPKAVAAPPVPTIVAFEVEVPRSTWGPRGKLATLQEWVERGIIPGAAAMQLFDIGPPAPCSADDYIFMAGDTSDRAEVTTSALPPAAR